MARKGRIQKRLYCAPKITRVNLRSEEAVLNGCKTSSVSSIDLGTYADGCKYKGNPCSTYTS